MRTGIHDQFARRSCTPVVAVVPEAAVVAAVVAAVAVDYAADHHRWRHGQHQRLPVQRHLGLGYQGSGLQMKQD